MASLLTRNIYELLKKAGHIDLESRPVFAAILTVMMVMWVSWFAMCPMDPFRVALPDAVRWIGLSGVILGWALSLTALAQLRGVENINHLVTNGLFAKLRHPMYTGFLLWLLGWPLFHGATISFVTGLFGIGSVLYWRSLEEKALESTYGDKYRVYQTQTWF